MLPPCCRRFGGQRTAKQQRRHFLDLTGCSIYELANTNGKKKRIYLCGSHLFPCGQREPRKKQESWDILHQSVEAGADWWISLLCFTSSLLYEIRGDRTLLWRSYWVREDVFSFVSLWAKHLSGFCVTSVTATAHMNSSHGHREYDDAGYQATDMNIKCRQTVQPY